MPWSTADDAHEGSYLGRFGKYLVGLPDSAAWPVSSREHHTQVSNLRASLHLLHCNDYLPKASVGVCLALSALLQRWRRC